MLSLFRDVTLQRRLEEQLRQSQKMEAIGQLAGGVAHDFNNLLTVIRGHTELLLERGRENSALVRDAEAIQKAAERATAITHQLLAFGRKQMLQPRVMDLNRVVTDMTAMLRRLIPSNIQLFPTVHASPLWVRADESQLEQVLLNLVVNARDAMPQGGTLSISTAHVPADSTLLRGRPHLSSAPHASLKVSDTGTGMDAATQARIFEPFFTTKEVGKGTGLGLATVYGIVNQSGGAIGVNSAPDKGSQFEIFLPEVAEPLSPNLPSIVRAGSARGTETILIAEDQEAVREMVTEFLSNLGYKVLPARNGAEALHLASHFEGPIHLLVTDAIMPEMGGAALATRLAQILPAIKILYVSGYASDEQALAGVVARGEAFLQKPFTLAALVQTIRVLLD
jgi:nitrogen-specific signal transduction histidine kinase